MTRSGGGTGKGSVAFDPAPDITTAIFGGRQPIELSARCLAITADLPMDRVEQPRELGFI